MSHSTRSQGERKENAVNSAIRTVWWETYELWDKCCTASATSTTKSEDLARAMVDKPSRVIDSTRTADIRFEQELRTKPSSQMCQHNKWSTRFIRVQQRGMPSTTGSEAAGT